MDDYYGYAPLLTLDRPLVVCGLPGTAVGRTARAMNLLSGIPFVWVDRRVEHIVGMSVERLQGPDAHARRLEAERTVLDEALGQRIAPLVALSDATYDDVALAKRLEADADVLLLHLDLDAATERVFVDAARDVRKHWALTDGGQATRETVRARLAERDVRYRHLARVVLVGDRPPLAVAQQILDDLGLENAPPS